jgi:hypothetical protein
MHRDALLMQSGDIGSRLHAGIRARLTGVRSDGPSRADQQLLAELAREGSTVSFTQIERWRYWRKTGLIPRTIQHGEGRGSRSEHADLDDSIARIREIEDLKRRYRNLDQIALVLTMRGRTLDSASVKEAVRAVLEAARRRFVSSSPNPSDAVEVAGNAMRAARHRANGNTPFSASEAKTAGAHLLAGAQVPPGGLEQLARESVVADAATKLGAMSGEVVTQLESHAASASYDNLLAAVEAATPAEIVQALRFAGEAAIIILPSGAFTTETDRDTATLGIAIALLTPSIGPESTTPT